MLPSEVTAGVRLLSGLLIVIEADGAMSSWPAISATKRRPRREEACEADDGAR